MRPGYEIMPLLDNIVGYKKFAIFEVTDQNDRRCYLTPNIYVFICREKSATILEIRVASGKIETLPIFLELSSWSR